MALTRSLLPALVAGLMWAGQLGAQAATGSITGRVVDATTQRPIGGATVMVDGSQRGTLTRADGGFLLTGVPAGTHTVRATLIGYSTQEVQVSVAAGAAATAQFALQPQAVVLEELVAVGYGTQRREAVTGSVATVNADEADVGMVSTANEMIQGRVAGVQITQNSGEPGSGAQIRIRGGTSISASNEPLYVVDGVPISNAATEAEGLGIMGSDPPLSRSPLAMLNPSDIETITILKDASATAIYGSRAANGVVLIETKRGVPGRPTLEYDGYVAMSTPASSLDLLNGAEYRAFVQDQVDQGILAADRLESLGTSNTNWERALTRDAMTHNHNLSFSGGSESTQFRASLNYMDQEGVVIENGFERIQGRLNASHQTLENRLRLGVNLMSSHMANDYLPYENTGGFEGGVFTNMVNFDPTQPVRVVDESTGLDRYYEIGPGRQSVANPVALAVQVADAGESTRTLGNANAALELLQGVTAQLNVGVDRSEGVRRTYLPRASPVGAEFEGRARQVSRENTAVTLSSFLTINQQFLDQHLIDLVGGYEFSEYSTAEFGAEGQGFLTDAFGYHNLGGGSNLVRPFSWRTDWRLVSFFSRANYSLADRYYLTGVLRYDGSSRFGAGNKWALFPAVSASWRISEEPFLRDGFFSDLRLRAGYGLQGNPGVDPYSSLITLEPGGHYVFGETAVTGVTPNRNPNPELQWEETAQWNVALDYGFFNNRFTGTAEYYNKSTTDLLLVVPVPQPALVDTRLENIGELRNRGFEFSLDAVAIDRDDLAWSSGLTLSADRNEVIDLGGRGFINTGSVSGQGQTGQFAQRIIPGYALGTFWGYEYAGVSEDGQQQFYCERPEDDDCVGGLTISPGAADQRVIGDANPDFALGFRNQVTWGNFDLSALLRGEFGGDVFNNTALVYATKSNVTQGRNFLRSALNDGVAVGEPAIYSSRWVEDGSFVRLQNVTLGYTFGLPRMMGQQQARVYVSGDNLLLITDYSGYDPEVHTDAGIASRGIDYLSYLRPRTITTGIRFTF